MEHLPEFVSNHWMMSSAFVIICILILINELQQKMTSAQTLEPFQVVNSMNRKNAVIIDIRSREIFNQGHILNAVNGSTNALEALNKYKQREVIIVCDSGTQAQTFSATLKQNGFEKLAILKGGMQAWLQAEMPITKETKK